MNSNQETRSDRPDLTFEVFGSWGRTTGDSMIDMAMKIYLSPDKSQLDREMINLMVDRGREIYMKRCEATITLEKGDTVLTPAGFMIISSHGTNTLLKAFTKVVGEERKYGNLKQLEEKIISEFYYILGYFSVLWEMEDVMGSKTVHWSASKEATDAIIDKSIKFVATLLDEMDSQIKEDLR